MTYAGQTIKGLDPGQNNEGYGYATISSASTSVSRTQTVNAALQADVNLRKDALGASHGRGNIRTNMIPTELFRPLSLRVRVHSDRVHDEFAHLLVYDGHPDKGGELIAGKLVHSGNNTGSSVWFEWIPRSLGRHTLYAKVVEKFDDSAAGNNVDTMTVNVLPPDTTPPQMTLILSPNQLRPADNQMVRVRAFITATDDQDRQPVVRLEAITHNEANSSASDVAGAEFGTDDRAFRLRAANSGKSRAGRIYEVVYSVTDRSGNKTFAKAYVRVPHGPRR